MPRGRTLEREKRDRSYGSRSRSYSRTKRGRYSTSVYRDSAKDSSSPFSTDIIRFRTNSFPKAMTMPMTYVEEVVLTCTSGGYANYQYKVTSLYDPNSTGGGHQPYLFDTLMQLYNVYIVYGVKVKLTLSAVTPNVPTKVAFQTDIAATAPTSLTLIEEQPDSRCEIINGSINNVVMEKYYDIAKLWGISKDTLLSDSVYQGTNGTNPAAPVYLTILAKPISSTTTTYIQGNLKLKQYAYFKQIIPQEES